MKKLLYTIIFASIFMFGFNPTQSKKDFFIELTDSYFPEYSEIINGIPEDFVDAMTQGQNRTDLLIDYAGIVHEAYHMHNGIHNHQGLNEFRQYFIHDRLSFHIPFFESFPSARIKDIVSQDLQEEIFRFDTYIISKDIEGMDTQVNGIHGLFEEFSAYYQDFKTYVEVYDLLKDQIRDDNTDQWIQYLVKNASIRNSLNEFQLFISWYLQYARDNEPLVYFEIIRTEPLKHLYTFIEAENGRLSRSFDRKREELIAHLGNRVQVEGEWISNSEKNAFFSMYDSKVQRTKTLLRNPEHQILDMLRTYH